MVKTPEEIKKGMECCFGNDERRICEECPYAVYEAGVFGDYVCSDFDAVGTDALSLIQQLEAQVPRWISVEERLPEKYRRVLGVCCMGVFETRYDGKYWRVEEFPFKDFITHWMPLPEAPEEDAHG